jgi:hypothetical protein
MGSGRRTVRLDSRLNALLQDIAESLGVSISSLVRYHLRFSLAIHDPDLTVGAALKDRYKELLLRDPESFLRLPLIDVLKPLNELYPQTLLKRIEAQEGNRQ